MMLNGMMPPAPPPPLTPIDFQSLQYQVTSMPSTPSIFSTSPTGFGSHSLPLVSAAVTRDMCTISTQTEGESTCGPVSEAEDVGTAVAVEEESVKSKSGRGKRGRTYLRDSLLRVRGLILEAGGASENTIGYRTEPMKKSAEQ